LTPTLLQVDPATLKPNPWNTNVVSPENERKLDASLKRRGLFKPILVRQLEDGSLEILGGEHRRDAAVRVGLNPVPVFNLGAMSDAQAKEIGLLDNSRYGVDDSLELAELLKGLGDVDQLSSFLPWSENDLRSIFASVDIDVDELGLAEKVLEEPEAEPPSAKAPKTHTMMRFKVPLGDAERIAQLIARTQKRFGYTTADDLTNAGDALVHLLNGADTDE
jgi:ParB-like chromosome segregation protein Spo0J